MKDCGHCPDHNVTHYDLFFTHITPHAGAYPSKTIFNQRTKLCALSIRFFNSKLHNNKSVLPDNSFVVKGTAINLPHLACFHHLQMNAQQQSAFKPRLMPLFPLYSAWRLLSYVASKSVHTTDFIYNPGGNTTQKTHIERIKVSSHSICSCVGSYRG